MSSGCEACSGGENLSRVTRVMIDATNVRSLTVQKLRRSRDDAHVKRAGECGEDGDQEGGAAKKQEVEHWMNRLRL